MISVAPFTNIQSLIPDIVRIAHAEGIGMQNQNNRHIELTNEELVLSLNNCYSDDTFDIIFRRFTPLLKKYFSLYPIYGYELDDFFQEGRIVLNQAIKQFDLTGTHYFASYYQLLLKNHLYNLYKYEHAQKRGGGCITVSLEMPKQYSQDDATEFSYLDLYSHAHHVHLDDTLYIREKMQECFLSLSKLEKKVFKFFLEEYETRAIAEQLNIDEIQVKNAISRTKRKLKHFINE